MHILRCTFLLACLSLLTGCQTIYHKVTTFEHDATRKDALITLKRIQSIRPGVTTPQELDDIFDGVRSSKRTYRKLTRTGKSGPLGETLSSSMYRGGGAGRIPSLNSFAPEQRAIVKQLIDAEAGGMVAAPRGSVNSKFLQQLQHEFDLEFALTRTNGERVLVKGASRTELFLPKGTTRIIAQTQPLYDNVLSFADRMAMAVRNQRFSVVVPEYGSPVVRSIR